MSYCVLKRLSRIGKFFSHPVLPSGQRPRVARHQLRSIPDKGWELCVSAARDTSNVSKVSSHNISRQFPTGSPAGGLRPLPGVPGLGGGHPDVAPPPGPTSPPAARLPASLPRPEAAPAVAGLRGLGRGLRLVAHTRLGRGDRSTRLQKVFPSLFRLLIFSLLKNGF